MGVATTAATVLIAARNAEGTIERAVRSALAQGDIPIVVIDDGSSDATVDRARACGGSRVEILHSEAPHGLGRARQAGLGAVATPFCIWLDADDELLPGRVARLVGSLEAVGADAAFDGAALVDGPSGRWLRTLPMPDFLGGGHAACRLFERNYLPGPAWPALRTATARTIGYDVDYPTGDDVDFIFRALTAGARFVFLDEIGYRQHAYPASLSRDLSQQRLCYRRALLKHGYSAVASQYRQAGLGRRVALWGLVSMAIFREEYAEAAGFLDTVARLIVDPAEVLEPTGPCPRSEGWREAFFRGTLGLLGGAAVEAAGTALERAGRFGETAEGCNNRGVALARIGRAGDASAQWRRALDLSPGYRDPRTNLAAAQPSAITTHPLRMQPSRREY